MKRYKSIPIKYIERNSKDLYLDTSENFLLKFFNRPESEKQNQITKVLNNNSSWPILYELSPQRRHLFDWYPFKRQETLLDLGAGCGPLTNLFSEKLSKVTCLELSPLRTKIISKRCADKENIEIVCGSIEKFKTQVKYDYVNLTGVLEYAGKFFKGKKNENIFEETPLIFLEKARSFLKRGGKLFIAIENPLGIRYFSGAVEDHTAELFEGIEGYPQPSGIRTFTKSEIQKILYNLGFSKIEFYFPIPDYKLPSLVLSEEYLKKYNSNSLSSLFTNVEYFHYPLFDIFSEVLFSNQLQKEEILENFANSFLIVATY